jgi:predicted CxxxxCH...CXXCH cytochrome family protein
MRTWKKAALALSALFTLLACSKANPKAISIDPVTGKHPSGWAVADTGGKHPQAYIAGPSACFECHGKNLNGGISGVSCFSASRSGISCHPTGPSGHPAGWSAPGAHGTSAKALLAGRDGIAHCQICHGTNFTGGIGPSCINTAGCHGAGIMAAHSPKPWRSTLGGRTHTTTDASNAAGCFVCHQNGANSTRVPSAAAPVGTAPGCFNNTMCHGVEDHATGWSAPSAHGAAAKQPVGGGTGLNACSVCHGAQFNGGIAEQSCLSTTGCHNVAAPHPVKPWRSTTGGLTHTTTDTSNAAQCATCHAGGANSTRTPLAGETRGITGCFDATMCHGAIGHPAGWNAPAQHGAQAKAAPSADSGFSSCQPCHGPAFINGAAPSCLNTAACHGAGVFSPHARAPWFSRTGGPTHTDTDQGNVGTCAICHTAGANSLVKPPFPATNTLAGCFNNTLCHFHQIPYKPSATIPASLHGGEAKKDLTVCQACHGNAGTTAFDGITLQDGTKTIACSSCHTAAKAHPTDWQGDGTYSHRTAGNRANACTLCHDVTQGRTAPLPAAPSCFSVTFTNGAGQARTCHSSGPGVAPHGVPFNNHNATARSNFSYCLGCHQITVNVPSNSGVTIPRCLTCHLLDPVANPNNCVSCHTNPPAGTSYPSKAGSHASHQAINAGDICGQCHSGLGLGTVDHLNRARQRAASVLPGPTVFGVLAKTGGLTPSFNIGTGVCSNTYCHGASLPGGSNTAPIWGQSGYLQGCGTCHGFPPAITAHTGFTAATPCAGCHPHVNATNTGFVDPTKHINGVVDVVAGAAPHPVPYPNHVLGATCLACHTDAVTAAGVVPPGCQNCHLSSPVATQTGCTSCHASPPAGTTYPNLARSHAPHATASKVASLSLACADCHTALGVGTVDHQQRAKAKSATGRNNPVAFSTTALVTAGGGTAPSYNDTSAVCSNLYCHGAKMPGGDATGSNRAPAWGSALLPATLSAAACGTCHGFPPSAASGHPSGITIPAGFPATATIGATCSCHANINSAGNSYANIFVNKALHINGIVEAPTVGANHAVPNYNHQSAGTGAACTGCHAIGTATSVYPAAVLGNPPDCRGCHKKAAPGTATGASAVFGACGSCHGSLTAANATTQGRPNGTAFPDRVGYHNGAQDGAHGTAACSVCHVLASSGTGATVNHGPGNRNANPDVVGPFVNGITTAAPPGKGVTIPANSVTCVHGTISAGCSGGGTRTNRW